MPTPLNATRADIIAMLRDGHSNNRIVRELRCDKQRVIRLRAELDLPAYVPAERTDGPDMTPTPPAPAPALTSVRTPHRELPPVSER